MLAASHSCVGLSSAHRPHAALQTRTCTFLLSRSGSGTLPSKPLMNLCKTCSVTSGWMQFQMQQQQNTEHVGPGLRQALTPDFMISVLPVSLRHLLPENHQSRFKHSQLDMSNQVRCSWVFHPLQELGEGQRLCCLSQRHVVCHDQFSDGQTRRIDISAELQQHSDLLAVLY